MQSRQGAAAARGGRPPQSKPANGGGEAGKAKGAARATKQGTPIQRGAGKRAKPVFTSELNCTSVTDCADRI